MTTRRTKAKPNPDNLRQEVVAWVVAARSIVRRLRLEAEEMVDELKDVDSPLRDLLDEEELGEAWTALGEAESQIARITPPAKVAELPSPMSVLSQQRKTTSG